MSTPNSEWPIFQSTHSVLNVDLEALVRSITGEVVPDYVSVRWRGGSAFVCLATGECTTTQPGPVKDDSPFTIGKIDLKLT